MMSPLRGRTVALAILLLTIGSARLAAQPATAPPGGFDSTAVFVANRGQWDPAVAYMTRLPGLDAWVAANGIVYDFYTVHRRSPLEQPDRRDRHGHAVPDSGSRAGHVVGMEFVGAQATPAAEERYRRPGYHNYFHGNDPARWASDVPLYSQVTLRKLYPGIDAVVGAEARSLRYDLIVAPGVSAAAMAMRFTGADGIDIGADGDLIIATKLGEVRQRRPLAYQEIGGQRRAVECSFAIEGGLVRFQLGAYDRSRPLVIDPLIYSTYIGGTQGDDNYGMMLDGANAILVGQTYSSDFPTTTGAYSRVLAGDADIYLTKLNATGTALIFSTFIGGDGYDYGAGLAIGRDGGLYVSGGSISANFPTTPGAFDRTLGASLDAVVLKLNSTGTALTYSTFLGGTGSEWSWAIAVNAVGDAFVVGRTESNTGFPTTAGAYNQVPTAAGSGYVTKLSSSGSTLLYSTLLGGGSIDEVDGVAIDGVDNAFVCGQTFSSDFPTTAGAYDRTYNGENDGFVTKINGAGTGLVYSTYLGGSLDDQAIRIGADASGNAYIVGETRSANFPTTAGAADNTIGGADAFVAKLNQAGTALVYSTFVGGSLDEFAETLFLDVPGNVYVAGATQSADLPTTADAHSAANAGGSDVFVSEVNTTGTGLVYSTYLGGTGDEGGYGLYADAGGSIYVSGFTDSYDFPVTPGAYQSTNTGPPPNSNPSFVSRICRLGDLTVQVTGSLSLCGTDSVQLTAPAGAVSYRWSNGATTRSVVIRTPGTYSVTIDNGTCTGQSNKVTVGLRSGPSRTLMTSGPTGLCQGDSLVIAAAPAMLHYHWSRGDTTRSIVVRTPGRYWAALVDSFGCEWGTDTIDVKVVPKPTASITALGPLLLCAGDSVMLEATADSMRYSWSTGEGTRGIVVHGAGTYSLRVTNQYGCSADAPPVTVTMRPAPVLNLAQAGPASYCATDSTVITATPGFRRYRWSTGDSTSRIAVFAPGVYTLTATDSNGCTATARATVLARTRPSVALSGPARFCDGGEVTLTVSTPGVGRQWPTGDTTVSIVVKRSGRYWAMVSDVYGCVISSDTVEVTVDSSAAFAIDGATSVCAASTVTYSVPRRPHAQYTWSVAGDGTIAAGAGTSQIAVQWGAGPTGRIVLHVSNDSTGCTADPTLDVTIGTSLHPNLTASRPPRLCSGDSITLDAGAYAVYGWSTGDTGRTITVADSGMYWARVQAAGGCSGFTDTIHVVHMPGPMPVISAPDGTVLCSSRPLALDAGAGYARYQWSTGAFTQRITATQPGIYQLAVTDTNGCTGSAMITVTALDVEIMPAGDIVLCGGDSVELRATPGFSTYLWSNGSISDRIIVKQSGDYQVAATNGGFCIDTSATVHVTVHSVAAQAVITAVDSITLRSSAAAAYQWLRDGVEIPGATGRSITADTAGAYTVRIIDSNGCRALSNVYIRTGEHGGHGGGGEQTHHIWLDTLHGRVGEPLEIALNVAPPLADSDSVTGYRMRIAFNARSLYLVRVVPGDDGREVRADRQPDSSYIIEGAAGSPVRGGVLYRLEMYGLVTAVPINPLMLDSVVFAGKGTVTADNGLVTLDGCDVGAGLAFDKAVKIESVRPHPIDGAAVLVYTAATGSQPHLVVRDVMGREVLWQPLPAGDGAKHEAIVGTGDLPSGLYRIELRDRNEQSAIAVMVIH